MRIGILGRAAAEQRLRIRRRRGRQGDGASLLADFGWPRDAIVDLGGIRSARGPEHYFLMFAAIMRSLGTATFNIRVVV